MGFDLGDLLPSGPAAAAAGQAAPDILGSYNKGAMDFLTLENALQNQQKQQRADLIAQQYLPIDLAVKNIKTLQDINVMPGTEMPEVNPFDLNSQMDWLKNRRPVTNAEIDIAKAKAQSEYGLRKTELTQDEINRRAREEAAKDIKMKRSERASKYFQDILEDPRFKNIKESSSKEKKESLASYLDSLDAIGDPDVSDAARRRFRKVLPDRAAKVAAPEQPKAAPAQANIIPAPGNPEAALVQSKNPPAPGAIRVLKNGRKFQLQPNGRYKEIL